MLPLRAQVHCVIRACLLGAFVALVWGQLAARPLWELITRTFLLHLGGRFFYLVSHFVLFAFIFLPAVLAAVLYISVLERRARQSEGETVCGTCGHTFRALVRPQCPRCGNLI